MNYEPAKTDQITLDPRPLDRKSAVPLYHQFFISAVARGESLGDAMTLASAAAALSVQRQGAAASIPTLDELSD